MRRSEKEIRGPDQIDAILQAAEVCRVAFSDEGQPYIVPLCFGYEPGAGALYFHSAPEGRKIAILRKNPRCCFEVEVGVEAVRAELPCTWWMRYQSVIGEGVATLLADLPDKRHGLGVIVRHYSGDPDGIPDAALGKVAVVRIDITKMTGKNGF